jgi:hypothetical protein
MLRATHRAMRRRDSVQSRVSSPVKQRAYLRLGVPCSRVASPVVEAVVSMRRRSVFDEAAFGFLAHLGVPMHRLLIVPSLAVILIATGCSGEKASCTGASQLCGGVCTNPANDSANCGACGTACSAGFVCAAGTCGLTCQAGLVNCDGTCIDPGTDRSHCGASATCSAAASTRGVSCANGQLCSSGSCVQTCSTAQVACPIASPTYCADLTRDPGNCGSCGFTCPAGQQCVTSGGVTACACPAATPDACSGIGGATFCTNTVDDPQNCGACGTACSAGFVCAAGTCGLTCQAGLINCDGTCIDPSTDRTHCGASATCSAASATQGQACGNGQLCSSGSCVQTCSPTQVACPGASPTYCADLTRDPYNCGACATTCPAGQQCVTSGGATSCRCPAATPNACTGSGGATLCTDTRSDPQNCGACGTACGLYALCVSSACVCGAETCPATGTNYQGAACVAGDCKLFCAANRGDCDGAASNGCESNLVSDAGNCGACGVQCATGAACISGVCRCSGSALGDVCSTRQGSVCAGPPTKCACGTGSSCNGLPGQACNSAASTCTGP